MYIIYKKKISPTFGRSFLNKWFMKTTKFIKGLFLIFAQIIPYNLVWQCTQKGRTSSDITWFEIVHAI